MLTEYQIKNLKPGTKSAKHTDGGGLYLEVTPSGGKHWRYRYRIDGKESVFVVGEYPAVKSAEARKLRDAARELVKQGINPTHQRRADRVTAQHERATTFQVVGDEWYKEMSSRWSAHYAGHVATILRNDVYPRIGTSPIREIKTPAIYEVLRKIVARQAPTRAILARQIIGNVFKFAILNHYAEFNVVEPLKGEIARRVVEHRKHLKGHDLPDFMRRLEDYTGHVTTAIALKLLLLTAVRPGELCGAAWSEFNIERAEWLIPSERMKMKKEHLVPLPHQALALLAQLRDITGHSAYLFPTQGTKSHTMPTATLRNAVSKMGFSDRFSPHGARGTFSTLCNELGYRPDVIERQLAHGDRNIVRASYNQAEYMPERRKMMQEWADLLDKTKAG